MAVQLTRAEKMTIIRKHYHEGKAHRTIARELHCSESTVKRALHQFVVEGDIGRREGSGRPVLVTEEVKEAVEKAIRRKRQANAAELAEAVEEDTGRRVSQRTMRRVRRQLRYHPVHVSVKPALSEVHMAQRLAWCREHLHDNVRQLGFMDEMGVCIDHHRRLYWIKAGEARPVRESNSVMVRLNVWGAIWFDGKSSLHITKDNFNARKYEEVLEAHLSPELPLGRRRFIQDGVPWHWSRAVADWFTDHKIRLVTDFPAKSPDLNAMEYVWGWMKYKIADSEPHDERTLRQAIEVQWEDLQQSTIRHFIEHITTVMREIIDAEGGHSH
jgi:transposase